MSFSVSALRRQFPILSTSIDGHPLVYLDTAATSQKPEVVLEAMHKFYREDNANAHRGMHVLAERATVAYENARKTVRKFLHTPPSHDIVFTHGTTESINLVAHAWGRTELQHGDTILLTRLEHHSNILPWQQIAQEKGARIVWLDIDENGDIDLEDLQKILKKGKVKLMGVTAQSNVLGTRPPLEKMIRMAQAAGAVTMVDGAQAVVHGPIDIEKLDCDFFAFSGHKLYGPLGIGVLCARKNLLRSMPPFLSGGGMVEDVRDDAFTPNDSPQRFEAGTPPIAEAVGLDAAITWLSEYSWKDIETHEESLLLHAISALHTIDGLHILGPADPKRVSGCISFTVDGVHPHDLTEILGRQGICLRAGHHCAQPLHKRLGITASTRVSLGIYNTKEEIDIFMAAIPKAIERLRT